MDARQRRTRESLEKTIIELAIARPLGEITVTDVAKAAGITRPTFYAHADSAGDLLASVLGVELEQIRLDFVAVSEQTPPGQPVMLVDSVRHLVGHVFRHRQVYRQNLRHRLPAQVRDILIDHVEWSLLDHLLRHPASAPHNPVGDTDDADGQYLQCALYAAMAASATVAALESWLRGPDPLGQEWVVQSILLGIPEWWERPTPVTP